MLHGFVKVAEFGCIEVTVEPECGEENFRQRGVL